jgi:hypothetical protein
MEESAMSMFKEGSGSASFFATSILFATLSLSGVLPASAETKTDALALVDGWLVGLGPQPVTTTTYTETRISGLCHMNPVAGPVCFPDTVTQVPHTTTAKKVLTAANVTLLSNALFSFGAVQVTSIPGQEVADFTEVSNCLPTSQPVGWSLQQTATGTSTVTLTTTIENTVGSEIGATYGISDALKIDAKINISNKFTTASAVATAVSNATTRTRNGTLQMPAMGDYIVEILMFRQSVKIPFSATVTLDADLSPNDRGWVRLSDAIPDPRVRTTKIIGFLLVDDATNAHILNYEKTPNICTAGKNLPKGLPYAPTSNDRLKLVPSASTITPYLGR